MVNPPKIVSVLAWLTLLGIGLIPFLLALYNVLILMGTDDGYGALVAVGIASIFGPFILINVSLSAFAFYFLKMGKVIGSYLSLVSLIVFILIFLVPWLGYPLIIKIASPEVVYMLHLWIIFMFFLIAFARAELLDRVSYLDKPAKAKK